MTQSKVRKLALTSRALVLLLQLLANVALPDHKPDVFRAPVQHHPILEPHMMDANLTVQIKSTLLEKTVDFALGGLRHWDAEYFLHIAEHNYSYENTLAFYPLYPYVVRFCARAIDLLGLGLTMRSCVLLAAVLLNIFCFCKAASLLYTLTQHLFKDPNKSWYATLLFCFNPASIFFTAAYSEAIFCWTSLYLMLECITELRFVRTVAYLALCITSRSNGLINAGFPIYFTLRQIALESQHRALRVVKILLCLLVAILPLSVFYSYTFQQFCLPDKAVDHQPAIMSYARERNYILAGHRQPGNSPWCDETLPFPYFYIQHRYWNVGFMRYYEWKQLPNFLLALPILAFFYYKCGKYLANFLSNIGRYTVMQTISEYKTFPFVLHALFLTVFCTFFAHIQVSTRLLCSASPCLYWFAADYFPRTIDQLKLRSKASAILIWFGGYSLAGTVLFSNNLPWT